MNKNFLTKDLPTDFNYFDFNYYKIVNYSSILY